MVKAKPKNRRSNREKKLRVGERFGGTVRDLTSSGDGVVAHPNGQVFFVSGVWPGEHGEFRISEFRGRSGLAELCALDQASPERVEPPALTTASPRRTAAAAPGSSSAIRSS
jgi:tRNA/tmRNA/rRNA uracil-C5-methylase (TrmA/RlmC/RlmD family)